MRRRKVRIPGGAKPWMAVLPEEFRDNPNVIVVCVPRRSQTRIGATPDGYRVGLLETKKGVRGLQILGAGGNYVDHQTLIEDQYRIPMADYQYAGALSRLPDKLLLNDELPLIFLRERFGEPYLNLKQFLYHVSKGGDDPKYN